MLLLFLLGTFTQAQFSLDSSLDRTFRNAAYHQRTNPNRGMFGIGRSYSTDFEQYSKLSGVNVREKDIAAIFRGVAYKITEPPGASTTSSTVASTTATTTTTTTTTIAPRPTTRATTSTTTTTISPIASSPHSYSVAPKSHYRTASRNNVHDETLQNSRGTLNIISPSANPEINEISLDESSKSGILNYFVEDNNRMPLESSHSGRREFYPEVISSVEPKTVSRNSRKFVVSKNGDKHSIDAHVYLIGTLMGLVGLASLLCLCRIHSCSQMIPRGHYVTLQLLILLAVSLRCITLLHDPYGLEGKLPRILSSLLMNTVPPILSTTFALMLLVLLRAAKFSILPSSLQSPVALAIVSGVHITVSVLVDISNGVLHYPDSSRATEAGIQCLTVGWESLLIIGYILVLYQAFIRGTKRKVVLPQYTCAVSVIAVLIKTILIGFMFYHIFNEELNSSYAGNVKTWSWWLLVSCERLLEIFLCVSLLTAAATLTMRQNILNCNEQKVFSVVSGYDHTIKSNTMGRLPANKNFMASNYALASTMQKSGTMNSKFTRTFSPTNSKTYESSDFTFQWNAPKTDNSFRTIDRLENVRTEYFDQRNISPGNSSAHNSMKQIHDSSAMFSKTLPQPRYYCAPVPVIANEAPVVGRITPCSLRPQHNPSIYCEIEDPTYDLASYYNKSQASTSSDIYCHPHVSSVHYATADNTSSSYHLYEHPGVHQSAASSNSNNIVPIHSYAGMESNLAGSQEQQSYQIDGMYNLVLPLQQQNQSVQRNTSNNIPHRSNNTQLDTSPDSAIVLDYSSHSEIEEHNRHAYGNIKNIQDQLSSPSMKLDFMKLSTHSLNDVFKHNSGLLSKLVSSNNPNTGYQPLNIDDIFPGAEVRQVTDTSSTSNGKTCEKAQDSSASETAVDPSVPVSSSPLISHSQSPVTSL